MKGIVFSTRLTLVLLLCSCRPQDDYGGKAIEAPGVFNCFDRALVVTVVDAPGPRLVYTLGRKRLIVGPSQPALPRDRRWLIYPERAGRVWVYDGERDITLIEMDAEGGAKFTSSQVVPELLRQAPPLIAQRFPPSA